MSALTWHPKDGLKPLIRMAVVETLEHTNNHKGQSAILLGVSIRTLRNWINEMGLHSYKGKRPVSKVPLTRYSAKRRIIRIRLKRGSK